MNAAGHVRAAGAASPAQVGAQHLGDVGKPQQVNRNDEPLARGLRRCHGQQMRRGNVTHVDHFETQVRERDRRAVQQRSN